MSVRLLTITGDVLRELLGIRSTHEKLDDANSWNAPEPLNGDVALIAGGVAGAVSQEIAIPANTEKVFLKCQFTEAAATSTLVVELRQSAGAIAPQNRRIKEVSTTAIGYVIDAGVYESDWIEIQPCGSPALRVHIATLSGLGTISIHGESARKLT